MSDPANKPNWYTPSPNDSEETKTEKELINLGIKGLIALKRLFMTPAGTSNENSAAREIVDIVQKIREIVDAGPKQ